MIAILSVLIGLYIVVDSVYLASKADGETRYCMVAKYTGAAMSGGYMVVKCHDEFSILFGVTIALFMWPDTYYRVCEYLKRNNIRAYTALISTFKRESRRKGEST